MSVDSQADNLLLRDKEEAPGLFTILKRNAAAAGIDLFTLGVAFGVAGDLSLGASDCR